MRFYVYNRFFLYSFKVIFIIFLLKVCVYVWPVWKHYKMIPFVSKVWMSWLVLISLNLKVSIKIIHRCIWRVLTWFHLIVRRRGMNWQCIYWILDCTFISDSQARDCAPECTVACSAFNLKSGALGDPRVDFLRVHPEPFEIEFGKQECKG